MAERNTPIPVGPPIDNIFRNNNVEEGEMPPAAPAAAAPAAAVAAVQPGKSLSQLAKRFSPITPGTQ